MKEDIVSKILQINNRREPRSISIRVQDIHHLYSHDLEFKNIYSTDISSIKASHKELFFEYFPYQANKVQKNNDLLPPRVFFDSFNNPIKYLLTESSGMQVDEYCPYLDYLKNLQLNGYLRQKKDKSVYLEIDDFFINLVSSTLQDSRIEKSITPYINIISKEEHKIHEVFPIQEIDQKFEFKIKGLYSINLLEEASVKKIWFLEIESQDLEDFRYKYHLFPKINGHNFSITLGFINYFKLRKSYPMMRINITFVAA